MLRDTVALIGVDVDSLDSPDCPTAGMGVDINKMSYIVLSSKIVVCGLARYEKGSISFGDAPVDLSDRW